MIIMGVIILFIKGIYPHRVECVLMEHSVAAYLARIPRKKAEQLWEVWVLQQRLPAHISSELVEILEQRLKEFTDDEKSP